MARMIPPQYDPSTASAAEKRIFHLLENDPDTSQWFALHSLGLSNRQSGPYGEIDFVILVPSGTVICLEVKGGNVSCKDGIWRTVDRSGQITEFKKSPFMQARDGMFALMHAIQKKFGKQSDAGQCVFVSAVIFPDVDSPPTTPEFETWERICREQLNAPISKALLRAVSAQRNRVGERTLTAPEAAIREIRQFLRPDFERIITRSTAVSECENSLIALTENQYQVLDMISTNARCLVEGAAGTGKTVLALEYARREATIGRRVLLLCFNRLLGDWFEARIKNLSLPSIKATNYHRFLQELVMASRFCQEFKLEAQSASPDKLFTELLPFYAQLSVESMTPQFDVAVIDEAQDLLSPEILELIGTLLKGGIAGGRWHILGDFTRQCIHGGPSREARLRTLNSACEHFTHAGLQTNCRNTRRIGEETALLSGFSSPPYKVGQIDGPAVDYRYWHTQDEEAEKLALVVQELLTDGMNPRDIVLLSANKFSDSVASRLSCGTQKHGTVSAVEIRRGVAPYTSSSQLPFATVQSFKGMESAAIVLCDVDHVEDDEPQALLYTGMSRARSLLVMLVHESVRKPIANALARRLAEGWKL